MQLIAIDWIILGVYFVFVLGNREVLGVNQDVLGKPAGRKVSDGWVEVWARPLDDGTMAVGLFNRGLHPAEVTVQWTQLGLKGGQPVRDLWQRRELGVLPDKFTATVPRHGAVFLKVGKPK